MTKCSLLTVSALRSRKLRTLKVWSLCSFFFCLPCIKQLTNGSTALYSFTYFEAFISFAIIHPLILHYNLSPVSSVSLATDHGSVDIDYRLRRTEWEFFLWSASILQFLLLHYEYIQTLTLNILQQKHCFAYMLFTMQYI